MNIRQHHCGFFLLIFAIFQLSIMTEARAEKTFWEKIFPFLAEPEEEGPSPEETLRAPFANDKPPKQDHEKSAIERLYRPHEGPRSNTLSLAGPHRHAEEIGVWLMGVVTDALEFNAINFPENQRRVEVHFTDSGYQDYMDFITQGNFLEILARRNLHLHAVAEEKPFLLNKGALNGRFRWLFEIPVMLNYLPAGQSEYRGEAGGNQQLMLRVQVGREPGAPDEIGVLIESWAVSSR